MLRKVWLIIRVEKANTYEEVIVKVLLDSKAIEVFIDKKIAAKHGFRLQKLERPLTVKNMDGTYNSRKVITHLSQTSFRPIFINSLIISMVLTVPKSP